MSGAMRCRAEERQGGVPLGVLLDVLGPAARPVHGRVDPDLEAHDVVLLDGDAVDATRGCVVLANGADPAGPGWAQLLGRLHEAAAVAILVRTSSGTAPAGPEVHGVPAVVVVDHTLSWDDAYHLLRSSLTATQAGGQPAAPLSGIPLGDLFALADAVAAACGGAVSIEDPHRRVLAHSSVPGQEVDETRRQGILDRRVPPYAVDEGVYRRLVRQGVVLAEHADDELPRLAVPVTAAGENLGSIWLIAEPGSVSPHAHDILRDAARAAAVHLLRARVAQDLERRLRHDLVVRLFDGTLSAQHVARRLRFPAARCAVAALDLGPVQAGRHDDRDRVLDQLADIASLTMRCLFRGTVAIAHEDTVYVLVPLEDGRADALVPPLSRVVRDARRALRLPVRAAVGRAARSLEDAPAERQQVDHLLRVMDRDPSGPAVVLVEARGHQVALQELSGLFREHPWLLDGSAVAAMAAADAHQGTHHVATVAAFLDCFGNTEAAARRLHIHPNTLRYRLRRVTEAFGVDLSDPDTRLVIGLALRSLADPHAARQAAAADV